MAVVNLEKRKRRKSRAGLLVAGGVFAGTVAGVLAPDSTVDTAVNMVNSGVDISKDAVTSVGLNPSCRIKGNVSIDSGERIYHVPGQEFYSATNIDLQYGERWFCTEAEAIRAGWRKARR